MYSFMIKRRKLLEKAIKNNYTIKETMLYLNTSYVNIDIALFEAKNTDYEFYLKALKNFNITEENHINKKTSGVIRSKNNIEKRLNTKFNTINDFYKYIKDTAIYIIDNNLSLKNYAKKNNIPHTTINFLLKQNLVKINFDLYIKFMLYLEHRNTTMINNNEKKLIKIANNKRIENEKYKNEILNLQEQLRKKK